MLKARARWLVNAGLALAALAGGPALIALAASDVWHTGGVIGFINGIFQSSLGICVCASLGYTLLISNPLDRAAAIRVCQAEAALVVILAGLLLAAFPLLFGLGEGPRVSGFYWSAVIIAGCVLVGAIAHHFILQSGVPAMVEIPAHLIAVIAPLLTLAHAWSGGDVNPSADMTFWGSFNLFGAWPTLVAVLPFAAILLWRVRASAPLRIVTIGLVMLLGTYAAKAALDSAGGKEMALLWPVRVAMEFRPRENKGPVHIGAIKADVGQPIQIGKHWYRFDQHVGQLVWPDGSEVFYLWPPSDRLGVPSGVGVNQGKTGVYLSVGPEDKSDSAGIQSVWTHYEDLTISVAPAGFHVRGRPSNSRIRQIIHDYVAAARIAEPAASTPN